MNIDKIICDKAESKGRLNEMVLMAANRSINTKKRNITIH
jgi:hypothetical protein